MANYTVDNRCTSVGHDLIQSYKKYLLDYEEKHPEDVHTEGLNKKVASTIPRGEKTIRVKLSTGAPRKRPASGDPRGGRGRGRGRGRPRGSGRGRGRPRAAVAPRRGNNFNFSIGNRVRVYWPSDDTWYSGMVVMQETTPEGVVYSKIDYDDGDEEVLNLANEICECLDEDEDGLVYRPRPSSRRGVDGGAPGRLALEYHGGHENETMREPISMEQILEAMNCREAARGLYELSGERHEGRETFRLGYMMGVRRAAFKAVDVMHAILARAFPEGDPMRDLVTREDLHKAVVDGTYEAEAESDREEEPPEDEANDPIETKNYDAPWPKDKNVPTEQEVLEELEGLRARAERLPADLDRHSTHARDEVMSHERTHEQYHREPSRQAVKSGDTESQGEITVPVRADVSPRPRGCLRRRIRTRERQLYERFPLRRRAREGVRLEVVAHQPETKLRVEDEGHPARRGGGENAPHPIVAPKRAVEVPREGIEQLLGLHQREAAERVGKANVGDAARLREVLQQHAARVRAAARWINVGARKLGADSAWSGKNEGSGQAGRAAHT